MITTRSLGSRSSFDSGFPSNSSSISLSSDRELVHQACVSLRKMPVEVQALDLSTNTRKPRRPLKNLKALSELTNLVQLDLSGNAVERLEGLQVFTQLKTLAMPRNHLKTLSAPLFALKVLTHLDLSGNFIAHLPRAFSGLTMLEELNLSGNNLGTLREVDVLAPLANLLSCSLAANPFCRLPTYKDYILCKIRSLERLDDVEISRIARDRAAKRFGNAMFSQDACLREADRVHEDEQNRLLEAQSALEAENLRLKGELQVKSKLLQNKSRAWSSATEQLLQLQQEVAMLNLDRRRSVSLVDDEPSDAEQIARAIAARHRPTNSTQQRPQSAPRMPSPERSVEKRRGSFSDRDLQLRRSEEAEDITIESRDAACMPMSPGVNEALKRSRRKMFVDASCSPLRVIPPAIITNLPSEQDDHEDDAGVADGEDEVKVQEYEHEGELSSPPQTWEQEEIIPLTRTTTPPAMSSSSVRQQRESAQSLNQVHTTLSEMDPQPDKPPRPVRRASASLQISLKDDEALSVNDLNSSRSSRFPTFEDDTGCPAYEDTHYPALQARSSSASALGNRGRNSYYESTSTMLPAGSHSLPPSPTNSPSRIRQWYRKQNELRLLTPPPSPPRRSPSRYKPSRPPAEASPLAPFVDKDVLARQIQALQSCKQSLLTEIRNEEHLLHVLKQESAQYADQIDCLSVNIQACLDGDPSAIRFSFSPPGSPRGKSKKLRDEETGRARLEILRNKLRFAEDKEKEIETTMVRMTKRVLHADLSGNSNIREKFSPVESSKPPDVQFDKEIFALTHKLQLVIVEKEEIHMQMRQLMAQLRGQTTAEINFDDDDGGLTEGKVTSKQVLSLAKSRQMVDELRTRHREVTERILLKERRISSLLEELREVEAELQHISSLNVSSAVSPLFQRERTATLEFFKAKIGIDKPSNDGGLIPPNLQFKELLSPDMLEEIKADIYEKLSQQLATRSDERSADGGARPDLHQAIAAALDTRLQLGTNAPQTTKDAENSTDEVCCDRFDEFAPVDAYYARKFVMAKDRVAAFVESITEDEGNTTAMAATHVTSAQRILKICERLDAAEARSKFDPVSKIEVDQQGNSRGSLKVQLLAARDLPTAHLRTKNLDPYVCLEVVYPSHALPPSLSAHAAVGRVFRSQTKKKSIYPVWEEDFEFAPILSLNGYLHVRVLNDRRLSREQLVGETRIPLHTLLHQKRTVEWFSLGLNVPSTSSGSTSVVSKLCGGAVRLQLQLYYSSVERYKHVVDELVTRYLHDHNQLPAFIDAIENRVDQTLVVEQPEQNGIELTPPTANGCEPVVFDQRRQMDADTHFPLDELATSLPPYTVTRTTKPDAPPSQTMNTQGSTQLSSERRKSLWDTKPSAPSERAAAVDDKKPYFGFSASGTERRRQQPASVLTIAGGLRRSQTPTAQSKRIRNAAALQHQRRRSMETPECFDEYSPYHPAFKSVDVLDGCNNELGGGGGGAGRNPRITPRAADVNRKTDLSIFKSPSLTRRPPSSGFPERYIGLDNQTCERLKRIFGRMDGTPGT
ncbi:hypothetical protein PHYSODRAFT_533392 [Phytophthora sojae]|uniref:C2 domain-containing protein n=1 Tax=Phytophthora sojae (strain P6497) TaxID=1094619 RepID=G5AEY8_PHYSP|nr:hypothetical protein PHYSODRAFT_533392 [Phytophthora sojae]EGZ05778.1 hypothetical protein PHYSODRAFT_533392 [Phytophthora sojae]|eukprot:XP_009538639.1 hypothetical protein PHYSODRAFT_533392 [Phytophthora sojae]